MTCVVNASPLIFLEKLSAQHPLIRCFDAVFMPPAAREELGSTPCPDFVRVLPVSAGVQAAVQRALGRLHRGELEAITLAQELDADGVVLDDLLARKHAQGLGLSVIGTVGVLLLAHKREFLQPNEVRQRLIALVEQHGMYLLDRVMAQIFARLAERYDASGTTVNCKK